MVKKNKRLNTILDVVFVGLLCLYAFAGTILVPFHGDESTLIYMSRDYETIFVEGDLDALRYQPPEPPRSWNSLEQFNRIMTGSVHPLTVGLARQIAGLTVDDLNAPWDWDTYRHADEYRMNVIDGALPGDRLLAVSRVPSTLMLAASIILVFLITRLITASRPAAWVASLIYTLNPAVLVNGRRAMQEGAMLFSSMLVIWIALQIIKSLRKEDFTRRKKVTWLVGLGVASGFAAACKHTSAVIIAAAFLAIFIAAILHRRDTGKIGSREAITENWLLFGAGLLSIAVFYVLMPIWWSWSRVAIIGGAGLLLITFSLPQGWPTWVARSAAIAAMVLPPIIQPGAMVKLNEPIFVMIDQRGWLMDLQAGKEGGMYSFGERVGKLLTESFFGRTEYYEAANWPDFEEIQAEIDTYQRAGLNGSAGSIAWGILLIGLLAAGSIALAQGDYRDSRLLVALWYIVPAIILLVTNNLPWQRYYIGLIAPLAVVQGLGVDWLIEQVRGRIRKREGAASSAGAG
ncbi:MAG: phospholipid carrier-dependent glycosyltransferase [Anaerolineae bacterium]|nr:phospholipid carrier-dependent glycosyltransferase [Anaerolineae bacterium]